jgi:hypothetical protein
MGARNLGGWPNRWNRSGPNRAIGNGGGRTCVGEKNRRKRNKVSQEAREKRKRTEKENRKREERQKRKTKELRQCMGARVSLFFGTKGCMLGTVPHPLFPWCQLANLPTYNSKMYPRSGSSLLTKSMEKRMPRMMTQISVGSTIMTPNSVVTLMVPCCGTIKKSPSAFVNAQLSMEALATYK